MCHISSQRRQTEYRAQIAKLDLHILELHYETNELKEEVERLKKLNESLRSYGVCKRCLYSWEHCECKQVVGSTDSELKCAKRLVRQVLDDLPQRREFLNPDHEKEMRVFAEKSTQYRMIEKGEILQIGDEFLLNRSTWLYISSALIGEMVDSKSVGRFRRLIPEPAVEALQALAESPLFHAPDGMIYKDGATMGFHDSSESMGLVVEGGENAEQFVGARAYFEPEETHPPKVEIRPIPHTKQAVERLLALLPENQTIETEP